MKSYKRKYKRYAADHQAEGLVAPLQHAEVTAADHRAEDSVVCLQDTNATTIEADIASDFLSILTNETITEFLENTGKS